MWHFTCHDPTTDPSQHQLYNGGWDRSDNPVCAQYKPDTVIWYANRIDSFKVKFRQKISSHEDILDIWLLFPVLWILVLSTHLPFEGLCLLSKLIFLSFRVSLNHLIRKVLSFTCSIYLPLPQTQFQQSKPAHAGFFHHFAWGWRSFLNLKVCWIGWFGSNFQDFMFLTGSTSIWEIIRHMSDSFQTLPQLFSHTIGWAMVFTYVNGFEEDLEPGSLGKMS
jgi:hypothetical protein